MASVSGTLMNCTGLNVFIYDEEGVSVVEEYPRSEFSARLTQESQIQVGRITTTTGKIIPVYSPQKFGPIEGLPSYDDEKNCPDIIVPMLVGQKLQETGAWPGAVLGPDTGMGVVRGDKGQIVGTKWLVQYCARKVLKIEE